MSENGQSRNGPEERGQTKSRTRVRDFGEVYTADREVNAMLDLVKNETERIDSRFLEPACGDGNFLAAILRRKLAVCDRVYGKNADEWERASFIAVSSIYGVDILADNVSDCRERLFGIWKERWERSFPQISQMTRMRENWETTKLEAKSRGVEETRRLGEEPRKRGVEESIRFLLKRNILCGNALSMLEVDDAGRDLPERAIVFSEWSMVGESKVQRRDFKLAALLKADDGAQDMFLSSDGSAMQWDAAARAFIPAPIKSWPLVDFWKIGEEEER